MWNIFISYSRVEKDFAKKVKDALEGYGYEVWIDLEDINYSEDWQQAIYRGIEQSSNFIFIVSDSSNQSIYCQREIDHAVRHNKKIIPIHISDAFLDDVHPEISKLNSISFEDKNDFSASVDLLVNTINTDLEWTNQHTDFQNKALEWQRAGKPNHKLLKKSDLDSGLQFLSSGTTGIEPRPTDLQVEFIEKSRLIDQRNKRRYLTTGIAVVMVLSVLLVYSIIQRNDAVSQREIADDQRNIAETQSAIADEQRDIAEEQRAIAEDQTIFAMNRLLVSESQQSSEKQFDVATLLGIEAWNFLENSLSRNNLLNLFYSTSEINWTVINKHDYPTALGLSPDGKLLLSANNGQIQLWEAQTGEEIHEYWGLGTVWALEFSPNLEYFAAGDAKGDVYLWRIDEEQLYSDPCFNSDTMYIGIPDIEFSPSGEIIAAAYNDGTLRFWNVDTCKIVHQIDNATPPLATNESQQFYQTNLNLLPIVIYFNITYSPDGRYFAWSDDSNNSIIILDTTDYSIVQRLPEQVGVITDLLFDSKNQLFVASKGKVFQWDINSGMLLSSYEAGASNSSITLDFVGDEDHLVSVGNDAPISIRDVSSNSFSKQIQYGHSNAAYFVTGSPFTQNFYTLGIDGRLIGWDYSSDGSITTTKMHKDKIFGISFSPDFSKMVSVGLDSKVVLWDLENMEVIGALGRGSEYTINSVVYHPSGEYFYTGGGDNTIRIWDADTGILLNSISAGPDDANWIYTLLIMPDGSQIISCHYDGSINFWNILRDSLELDHSISRDGRIRKAELSPSGDKLLFTEGEFNLVILDIQSKREILTIDTDSPYNSSNLQISASGDWVLIAKNTTLQMYDVTSGEMLDREFLINEGIESIALHPDNSIAALATLTVDGQAFHIIIVDLQTGNIITKIPTSEKILTLEFSPDGKLLFAGNAIGEIKLYTFDINSIISDLCDITSRNLTQHEWEKYIEGNEYHATCSY